MRKQIECVAGTAPLKKNKKTQHTTPIAKFHISADANLVLSGGPFYSKKIPFLQSHQHTTGTRPEQHRNTTKTWARLKTSLNTVKTSGHTAKVPPRHQQEDRHHQPSGLTPSGQTQPIPEKAREGFLFSQNVAASIRCHNIVFRFSHHHHHNTISTDIHHHQNTIVIIIIIFFFIFIFIFIITITTIIIIIFSISSSAFFHQPCP